MAKRSDITPEILRQLIEHNPDTGLMTWKRRDINWFPTYRACKIWNAKYAGSPALNYLVRGRLRGEVLGFKFSAHRVIWALHYGKWPDHQIDHINRNSADNRIANLRDVTGMENMKNLSINVRNKSGYPGVQWREERKCWYVSIRSDGKFHYLGVTKDLDEAISIRKAAEQKFGHVIP